MRRGRGVLGRGLRVGLVVAGAPALPWAALLLPAGAVMLGMGVGSATARSVLRFCGYLIGGTVLVGVLTGLVLAGGLSLAARVFTGTRGLGLVGALLAGVVFPAEIFAVAAATDVGPLEFLTTFLLWPVMMVVAGLHSADIVGRTRRRAWLWAPWPGAGVRRWRRV
ncbi:hypothetical protein [Streptomyces sp. NPDC046942]|uniref:hypothetical protein n=1 Tax=Streptomyces sp. NPDC046942 TaxID=3155137 RepID=UPI00340BBA0F